MPNADGQQHFGAQVPEKRQHCEETWEEFMGQYPHWDDFTVETIQEDWTALKYCKAQHKQLNSRYEKGELTAEEFEKVKQFFSKMTLDAQLDF